MPMDIHKQAIEKYQQVKFESNEKPLETLFTYRHVFVIYLHKLPFPSILDVTDKSHELLFEFNYYGQFLLFKWYKMPFEHFLRFRRKVPPEPCEQM